MKGIMFTPHHIPMVMDGRKKNDIGHKSFVEITTKLREHGIELKGVEEV